MVRRRRPFRMDGDQGEQWRKSLRASKSKGKLLSAIDLTSTHALPPPPPPPKMRRYSRLLGKGEEMNRETEASSMEVKPSSMEVLTPALRRSARLMAAAAAQATLVNVKPPPLVESSKVSRLPPAPSTQPPPRRRSAGVAKSKPPPPQPPKTVSMADAPTRGNALPAAGKDTMEAPLRECLGAIWSAASGLPKHWPRSCGVAQLRHLDVHEYTRACRLGHERKLDDMTKKAATATTQLSDLRVDVVKLLRVLNDIHEHDFPLPLRADGVDEIVREEVQQHNFFV